jgi:hypothetical protein
MACLSLDPEPADLHMGGGYPCLSINFLIRQPPMGQTHCAYCVALDTIKVYN